MTLLPYNPHTQVHRFGLLRFRSPLLTKCIFVYFPLGTEMFYFPRCTSVHVNRAQMIRKRTGFPHSEIFGSKIAQHLPEAYRSYTTSFIVF